MKKILIYINNGIVLRDFELFIKKLNKLLNVTIFVEDSQHISELASLLDLQRSQFVSYSLNDLSFLQKLIVKFRNVFFFLGKFDLYQFFLLKICYIIPKLNEKINRYDIILFPTIRNTKDLGLVCQSIFTKAKIYSYISSWDNLEKGVQYIKFKKIFVWNEFMKLRAKKNYCYKDYEIKVIGPLQMDHYINVTKPKTISKNQIVYGTIGYFEYRLEVLVFKMIYKYIYHNYDKKYKFIFRVHPHEDHKIYESYLKNYKNVKIDYTNSQLNSFSPPYNWFMDSSEVQRIGKIIAESLLVISMASTFSVECSYFDTPGVIVAFYTSNSLNGKVQKMLRSSFEAHFKYFLDEKLIPVIYSIDDLKEILEEIIYERTGKIKFNTQKLKRTFFPFNDGSAAERFIEILSQDI